MMFRAIFCKSCGKWSIVDETCKPKCGYCYNYIGLGVNAKKSSWFDTLDKVEGYLRMQRYKTYINP
jgi:hypothetical protein